MSQKNELRYEVDFLHVVRYTEIHLLDSVHSYGCSQALLGVPRVIPTIHVMSRLDWAKMLIFRILVGIRRNIKLIQSFRVVWQSASWAWPQNSLRQSIYLILSHKISPEWLELLTSFFMRQFSMMIETRLNRF